MLRYI